MLYLDWNFRNLTFKPLQNLRSIVPAVPFSQMQWHKHVAISMANIRRNSIPQLNHFRHANYTATNQINVFCIRSVKKKFHSVSFSPKTATL